MNIKNTIIILIVAALILVIMAGCQKNIPTPVSETACAIDSDCACGTHKDTGDCFVGNKAFVNVEKQCPDFCTGIAVMFETKCINKECKQARIQPAAECTTDDDCVPDACCHATTCKPGKEQPECAAVSCSTECLSGTIDCGGSCNCEEGRCIANLNDFYDV